MATVKIASIFWEPLTAKRAYAGEPYTLQAVPLGAPAAILEIRDTHQIDHGAYGQNNHRERIKRPVDAYDIASCLVREWAGSGLEMGTTCHPGVWVVRERLPQLNPDGTLIRDGDGIGMWREATEKEKSDMWAEDFDANVSAQRDYADVMFNLGEKKYEDPRLRPWIPRHSFSGARHYGMEAEWLAKGSERNVKTCQHCTSVIKNKATICPKCQQVVDIDAYARHEVEKQEAVRSYKQQLKTA